MVKAGIRSRTSRSASTCCRPSLSGFSPAQQVLDIHSTVAMEADLQLGVGSIAETVQVSADALLETSSTGSHVDLGANLIDRLPSATPSKQLSAMLLSAPGFIPSQNGRIHVRGSHGQIQYVVDGVPMTDEYTEAFANPLDPRYVKSASVMTGGDSRRVSAASWPLWSISPRSRASTIRAR